MRYDKVMIFFFNSYNHNFYSLCSNLVYGDKNLARAMDFEVVDLHDVQSLQDTEDAEKFREKAEVMFPKIQEVVPTPADELDDVRVEGKVVRHRSILGGVASILAVIVYPNYIQTVLQTLWVKLASANISAIGAE